MFAFSLTVSAVNASDYQSLTQLFKQWREFEQPPLFNNAPDYRTKTFDSRFQKFELIRQKLLQIETTNWSIDNKVDWHILWAELNGYEFNYKLLKPWQRDPAFYKSVWNYRSDVPAHEGPTHHGVTELWTYQFPLSEVEQQRLIGDLSKIEPLNQQAKINLTGNAAELWKAGIRDIYQQTNALVDLQKKINKTANSELLNVIKIAIKSTRDFTDWLEIQAELKNGPSGIGQAQYTWYMNNVHLVPLSWQDEVRLLKRELDRSWSSLKLEEHRNRKLPQLIAAANQAEYDELKERSANNFLKFLDKQEIVTVADYFENALKGHLGPFVAADKRNFFLIGSHFDPTPLYSHFYHWFELARMDNNPHASPIRREALLYNIFDSRNEGTATAVEEMFMHAGLYDDNPRVREIVWIMIAQRAARGLGSLYAHANQMTMAQAGQIHADKTPRGWMKVEPELLIFEQHLYMRQPGYGSSYVTGKYLLERTMADYAILLESQGKDFRIKDFFDQLNSIGSIPIALGRWQMTGLDDEIKSIRENYQPLDSLK
ncbi:MAG: hypothetical protein HRT54_08250 [Colwellia sp.]|nr:hypothetical protein [Colwellia sp.]